MTADDRTPTTAFYKLERTLTGIRLVPVAHAKDATHATISTLQGVVRTHAQEASRLRHEIEQCGHRIQDLERQLGRAIHRADESETEAAQLRDAVARAAEHVRRLGDKNAELIGEKRRLRDALTGKHPLPAIHMRLDIDRDGVARLSLPVTLDTFPHRDHLREALAEGQRVAAQQDGQLRSLRLDTSAWRAVIQRVIDA